MDKDKRINLDDIEKISNLILGYKKNGRPRAIYDVFKCVTQDQGHKGKKKSHKKKHHKKKSKGGKTLDYFYKHAFDNDVW